MVKVGLSETIKRLDKYCIDKLGIPEIVLMENAALKVIKNLDLDKSKSFTIICGSGTNGGDGFAVARQLIAFNKEVDIFFIGSFDKMGTSTKTNFEIIKNMDKKIESILSLEDINKLRSCLEKNDVTIDAIFGIGLNRRIEGNYDKVISVINENAKNVVSIDVPSGLNSDTGMVMGNCVKSNLTVTFQLYKEGFLNYGADKYAGKVVVEEIGIPEFVLEKLKVNKIISEEKSIKKEFLNRSKYAHKGKFGRVLIFAGSRGYTGAACLCTEAAVKSGAGLITLCSEQEVISILNCKLSEAMTVNIKDEDKTKELLDKSDVVAIGPGMGNNEETLKVLHKVIKAAKCPIVIDADAINVLSSNLELLREKRSSIVLTPHVGEMSRLTGLEAEYINKNRIEVAEEFANTYGVVVLLKGYNTVVTDGKSTVINSTGNSAMASGGMGDCLTGIIAALIGQGYEALKAAYCGAFIHGWSGDKLSEKMYSVSASEVVKTIPYAMKYFSNT